MLSGKAASGRPTRTATKPTEESPLSEGPPAAAGERVEEGERRERANEGKKAFASLLRGFAEARDTHRDEVTRALVLARLARVKFFFTVVRRM